MSDVREGDWFAEDVLLAVRRVGAVRGVLGGEGGAVNDVYDYVSIDADASDDTWGFAYVSGGGGRSTIVNDIVFSLELRADRVAAEKRLHDTREHLHDTRGWHDDEHLDIFSSVRIQP